MLIFLAVYVHTPPPQPTMVMHHQPAPTYIVQSPTPSQTIVVEKKRNDDVSDGEAICCLA